MKDVAVTEAAEVCGEQSQGVTNHQPPLLSLDQQVHNTIFLGRLVVEPQLPYTLCGEAREVSPGPGEMASLD